MTWPNTLSEICKEAGAIAEGCCNDDTCCNRGNEDAECDKLRTWITEKASGGLIDAEHKARRFREASAAQKMPAPVYTKTMKHSSILKEDLDRLRKYSIVPMIYYPIGCAIILYAIYIKL